MANLPLGVGAYSRTAYGLPEVRLENRYFEQNPTLAAEGASLLSRPGTRLLTNVGAGPIRRMWSQEGTFGGDLFVVSGDGLWRVGTDLTKTAIPGIISLSGAPVIDGTREFVWIADGTSLKYYNGVGSFALNDLTFTGNAVAGETVTIGSRTYTWSDPVGAADTVLVGADAAASIANLVSAIAAVTPGGGSGIQWGVGTAPNTDVRGVAQSATVLRVLARTAGVAGNTIATTETMTNASWATATLTGGAANALNGVTTPDDLGVVSLGVIAGFVILVMAQGDRIYFIRPGETEIRDLDFFTAETKPDQLHQVMIQGDSIWLFGEQSSELWYVSGDATLPFARQQGTAFSRGTVAGTAVLLDNRVIVVGDDSRVYVVAGGGFTSISNHGIEERVRRSRAAQRVAT